MSKIVNITDRAEKEAKKIFNATVRDVQKQGGRLGSYSLHLDDTKLQRGIVEYSMLIETNIPEFAEHAALSMIDKSDFATRVSSEVYPGHFDWAADTYIKDCIHVYFKF